MNPPSEADQIQRDQMRDRLEANIAVRAAAGSGKTRSTVDRIVAMAMHENYRQFLPQLVVVTFTNAAADELRTRARKLLIEEHHEALKHLAGDIIPKFGQIFFGTIHSFCMRILREFGHQIELPSELESFEDRIDEIHERFRRERADAVWASLDRDEALRIFRFGLSFEELVQLGKELSLLPIDCSELARMPELAEANLLKEAEKIRLDPDAFEGCETRANSAKTIQEYIDKYKNFCEAWNSSGEEGVFIAMLGAPKSRAADVMRRSEKALERVHDWYARGVLKLGLCFAAAFQAYRWEKGCLTFNDQILLASRLVSKSDVLRTLRGRNLRVILDEAQDTTPAQFRILSELTRPFEAVFGSWPAKDSHPPRPGHFVMVGDEQQCIYTSSGAEIESYTRHADALESVVFHVTFRCNRAVVKFVNDRFPKLLHGKLGQAQFVELKAQRNAEEGRIGTLKLKWAAIAPEGKRVTTAQRFEKEMELLVSEIKTLGPKGLGAERWSDVAILMPRNDWLTTLAGFLERSKIPFRMTARRKNESIAGWRWFTALLAVLAGHDDGYELTGVLREIFGISDAEMAGWVFSGKAIGLEMPTEARDNSRMAATLRTLRDLRRRMETMPALTAVDEMMRSCSLAQRWAALAGIPQVMGGPPALLESLRARAARAEAEGVSWKRMSEELLEEQLADIPELLPSEGQDAITLMTCQKAKGQEWPVVILPGLKRGLRPPPAYLKTIEVLKHQGSIACRTRGVQTCNWKEAFAVRTAQSEHEIRRVYYVACTRARKHLILVDSRALWTLGSDPKKESKLMTPLWALSAPGEGDKWLDDIAEWTAPKPERKLEPSIAPDGVPLADLKAIAHIAAPKIIHPSDADEDRSRSDAEEEREHRRSEPRVEPLHGALIYGNWWHDVMLRADWSSKELDHFLRASVEELPQGGLRERGRHQIETFLRSDLFGELRGEGILFHRELAYARTPIPDAIEDGKIDLIYRIGAEPWRIIDWKTDVVSDLAMAKAHAKERYAGQLNTYVEALTQFGVPLGKASLYFTAIGETVNP